MQLNKSLFSRIERAKYSKNILEDNIERNLHVSKVKFHIFSLQANVIMLIQFGLAGDYQHLFSPFNCKTASVEGHNEYFQLNCL